MNADRYRAYAPDGHVMLEAGVPLDGPIEFTSEDKVSHVVFYEGDPESEAVWGRVDVDASGDISISVARGA